MTPTSRWRRGIWSLSFLLTLPGAAAGYAQQNPAPPPTAPAAQLPAISTLLSQAATYRLRGDYSTAEQMYRQVLGRREEGLESQIVAYKGLALIHQAAKRFQQAFDDQTSAMSFEQEWLTQRLERRGQGVFSDESQTITSALSGGESLEVLVSMAAEDLKIPPSLRPVGRPLARPPYQPNIQRYALAWTLLRKAIALDTLSRLRWLGKPDANRTQRVREIRAKLSQLALSPPPALDAAGQAKLKSQLQNDLEIEEDLSAIENRMHPQTAIMLDAPLQVGNLFRYSGETELDKMDNVTRLPEGAVLIEFLKARVFDFHAASSSRAWKPAHYYAFVLPAEKAAPVAMVDLGEAAAIDTAIKDVRRNILDFTSAYVRDAASPAYEKQKEIEYRDRARKLYDLVFAPLRLSLGPARLVYIAPDSELNRVSFEALGYVRSDREFAYLVDDYRFAYLTSGRDLATPSAPLGSGTVVLADPDYDLAAEKRERLVTKLRGSPPPAWTPRTLAAFASDTVGFQPWPPLHASAREADLVQRELHDTHYGPVRQYVGGEALEERLLTLQSPRILHIATHGFFLPGQKFAATSGGGGVDRSRKSASMEDPLLHSGIVLAGANRLGKEPHAAHPGVATGWVTAEEIMSLDLHGTELVVLSGCDTGLGDIQTGEGVFGLRRAFLYAGAHSLLVSLYKVPDEETVELMARFYESLKAGVGTLDSFHAAQMAVRASKLSRIGVAHPFYWASFILVGNPTYTLN